MLDIEIKNVTLFIFIFLLTALLIFNVGVLSVGASTTSVVFTAIMYDWPGSDDDQEWVEVYNDSTQDFIIDESWRFFDGANHLVSLFQGDNIFSSGEALVIVSDPDNFLLNYPDYQGGILDSVLSLSNSGEEIKLSFDGGVSWVAQITYDSIWGAAGDGYSLEHSNDAWGVSQISGGSPGEYIAPENLSEECSCDSVLVEDEVVEEETPDLVGDSEESEVVVDEAISTSSSEAVENEEVDNEDASENGSEDVEETIIPVYSDKIIVSELLPDPAGADEIEEYIELFNSDDQAVDLTGWWLEDDSGKKYSLSGIISSAQYLAIYRPESKITLNNSTGDLITLFNPTGTIVSQVQYEASVAGQSYSFFTDGWQWTENITPNAENVLFVSTPESEVSAVEVSDSEDESVVIDDGDEIEVASVSTKPELRLISEIRGGELNSEVYTQGVVTAPPGLFAETYFYIAELDFSQDVNLSSGIQIYYSKKLFPSLAEGDVVVVLGKLSQVGGELRIKITTTDDIQVLENIDLPAVDEFLTGEISDDYEGGLISVQGDLVSKQSNSWYLDDDSGEIRIYFSERAGVVKPTVELGQSISITGILSETKSGFRVLPRATDDVFVEEVVAEVEAEIKVIAGTASKTSEEFVVSDSGGVKNVDGYLGYGLGVVGLSLVSWVVRMKFLG
jgi:DNA/RNA endonuclease YhcR with UshA esterase domain